MAASAAIALLFSIAAMRSASRLAAALALDWCARASARMRSLVASASGIDAPCTVDVATSQTALAPPTL